MKLYTYNLKIHRNEKLSGNMSMKILKAVTSEYKKTSVFICMY